MQDKNADNINKVHKRKGGKLHMNNLRNQKGFTIIEVVLVLAIAGLIFLMVFIALPALQRSQRDTQRRDDVARVASQINSFQTNNNGKIPTADQFKGDFATGYLKWKADNTGEFKDPKTGNGYTLANSAGPAGDTDIVYVPGASCNGEAIAPGRGGSPGTRYAIQVKLEGSGFFCKDNGNN